MNNMIQPEAIQSYLKKNEARYIKMLEEMVAINSFTTNPEGINKHGKQVASIFAHLGFQSEAIQSTKERFGKHQILTKTGTSGKKIGFISHLDTVYSAEEEERNQFSWRVEGNKIYGPGTIDIKGGTVMIYMILDAIKQLDPTLFEEITWIVLLDASEEDDATDFGLLCLEHLDQKTLGGLVFEMGKLEQKEGLLVVARKGRAIFEVTVEGRASHSGTSHQEGASAIIQLAEVVQKINSWTDYEKTRTFNVGTFTGGTLDNRVPHHAQSRIEMRAFSREAYEEGRKAVLDLDGYSSVSSPSGKFHCKVSVKLVRETAPWPKSDETEKLFQVWQGAAQQVGYSFKRQERGGLSDANLICHQVPVIDGLGPAGDNTHCSEQSADGSKEQEYLWVPSLVPKTLINTLAVISLAQSGKESS